MLWIGVYDAPLSSIYFSVCPFVSNKRQNGWTDRAQIVCGTSHVPKEVLWYIKIERKKILENSWNLFLENAPIQKEKFRQNLKMIWKCRLLLEQQLKSKNIYRKGGAKRILA